MSRVLKTTALALAGLCLWACGPPSDNAAGHAPERPARPESATPITLAGTSWLVDEHTAPLLHVSFSEDGTVAGDAGCNRFTGSFRIDGARIAIGPLASTQKMCVGDGVMERESAFLAALDEASAWEVRAERLRLLRDDGTSALDLVSAVSGTVTYRTRRALPPTAEITISLVDVSRADAAAIELGRQTIPAAGAQVPFAFRIPFDPASIDPRHSYAVRATITVDGELIYTSTRRYPVITRDNPRYGVEIVVDPA